MIAPEGGGKYFSQHDNGAGGCWSNWRSESKTYSDFACQVEGRVTGPATNCWSLALGDNLRYSLHVQLFGDGKFVVDLLDGSKADRHRITLLTTTHRAIRPGPEFNTITAVLRSGWLELYVNGVAVCDPILLDVEIPAASPLLELMADNGRAEFERLTIWPADGIPTPEQRWQSGAALRK